MHNVYIFSPLYLQQAEQFEETCIHIPHTKIAAVQQHTKRWPDNTNTADRAVGVSLTPGSIFAAHASRGSIPVRSVSLRIIHKSERERAQEDPSSWCAAYTRVKRRRQELLKGREKEQKAFPGFSPSSLLLPPDKDDSLFIRSTTFITLSYTDTRRIRHTWNAPSFSS